MHREQILLALKCSKAYCMRLYLVYKSLQRVDSSLFVCLFDSLRPLNNISVMQDGSSWVEPVLS